MEEKAAMKELERDEVKVRSDDAGIRSVEAAGDDAGIRSVEAAGVRSVSVSSGGGDPKVSYHAGVPSHGGDDKVAKALSGESDMRVLASQETADGEDMKVSDHSGVRSEAKTSPCGDMKVSHHSGLRSGAGDMRGLASLETAKAPPSSGGGDTKVSDLEASDGNAPSDPRLDLLNASSSGGGDTKVSDLEASSDPDGNAPSDPRLDLLNSSFHLLEEVLKCIKEEIDRDKAVRLELQNELVEKVSKFLRILSAETTHAGIGAAERWRDWEEAAERHGAHRRREREEVDGAQSGKTEREDREGLQREDTQHVELSAEAAARIRFLRERELKADKQYTQSAAIHRAYRESLLAEIDAQVIHQLRRLEFNLYMSTHPKPEDPGFTKFASHIRATPTEEGVEEQSIEDFARWYELRFPAFFCRNNTDFPLQYVHDHVSFFHFDWDPLVLIVPCSSSAEENKRIMLAARYFGYRCKLQ